MDNVDQDDFYEECNECETVVGKMDAVEHPAYPHVFCSVKCKNRYLNRVRAFD